MNQLPFKIQKALCLLAADEAAKSSKPNLLELAPYNEHPKWAEMAPLIDEIISYERSDGEDYSAAFMGVFGVLADLPLMNLWDKFKAFKWIQTKFVGLVYYTEKNTFYFRRGNYGTIVGNSITIDTLPKGTRIATVEEVVSVFDALSVLQSEDSMSTTSDHPYKSMKKYKHVSERKVAPTPEQYEMLSKYFPEAEMENIKKELDTLGE